MMRRAPRPIHRASPRFRCRTCPLRSRRWSTRWASSGFRGVTLGDHVDGRMLDEKAFRPFWREVEAAGAAVFFHQCSATVVEGRTERYGLPNTIGNLTERAITFGTLVFGGVMDEFPDLKICLGHAGGYTAFGDRPHGQGVAGRCDGEHAGVRGSRRSFLRERAERVLSAASTTTRAPIRRRRFGSCWTWSAATGSCSAPITPLR